MDDAAGVAPRARTDTSGVGDVDVDGDLASGQLHLLSQDAHRLQEAMKDRSGWPIEALVDSQSSGDGRRRYVRVVLSVSSLGFTRPSLWTISTV